MANTCTLVIVNYNNSEITKACLMSIKRHLNLKLFQVLVIDNASMDNSVRTLNDAFSEFEIIRLKKNRGYGAALNEGLNRCNTEYIVFLNNDILFLDASLQAGIDYMKAHPDIAASGALNLNVDKTPGYSYGYFPFIWTILCDNYYLNRCFSFLPIFRNALACVPLHFTKTFEINYPIGAFMLLRTRIAKQLRGFDERFFLYFEETDFFYRVRQKGKVVLNPALRLIHMGGATTKTGNFITSPDFFKSWGYFLLKHRGRCYSKSAKYLLLISHCLHYLLLFPHSGPYRDKLKERLSNLYSAWQ